MQDSVYVKADAFQHFQGSSVQESGQDAKGAEKNASSGLGNDCLWSCEDLTN